MTFAIWFFVLLAVFITGLNMLPIATELTPVINSAIIQIVGYMKMLNFLLPITELFWCVVVFTGALFVNWVAEKLWQTWKALRGNNAS